MTKNSQSFSLSLKISGQIVKLLINLNQTKDETFERLANLYPDCYHKKSEILDRIIETLNYQLDEGALNQKLKGSIEIYLRNNDAFITYRKHSPLIVDKSTAFNNINRSKSKKACSALKKKDMNISTSFCQRKKVQFSNKIVPKKSSIPNSREKKMNIVTPVKKLSIKNPKSVCSQKKKVNPDIVKACEIILKKTTNNDMKSMAKQFLKQKGILKEQKDNHMTIKNKFHALSIKNQQEAIKDQTPLTEQSSDLINCKTKVNVTPQKICQKPKETLSNHNKFNRYKYLQPSMAQSLKKDYSQSLKKDYSQCLKKDYNQSLKKDYSMISYDQKSMQKSKKYNYLNDS